MANFLSGGDVMLIFPDNGLLLRVQEGSGDNLLNEDRADGLIDYIDWTSYKLSCELDPELQEYDGGMAMFRNYVSDLPDEQIISALRYEAGIDPDARCFSIRTGQL